MPRLAVLTGDLIESSGLTSEQLDEHLLYVKIALEAWADGESTHFTRQSGDGWQAIIYPSYKALRCALYVRAWLKGSGAATDTRIFIAEGDDTIPPSGNLNDASGPVFVASGRGLRALGKRHAFGHSAGGAMSATVRLADHISQGWTEAQARVVLKTLRTRRTQEKIATDLGLSQQSVQQTLAAAAYPALADALDMIEAENA